MSVLKVVTDTKEYPVVFYSSFDYLLDEIKKLNINISKIALFSDQNVSKLYGIEVEQRLKQHYNEVYSYTFMPGEANKNLTTVSDFYKFMIDSKLDRKSLAIALGGGVTGDMVGFAAATYMRGIPFIQIPTTLLSQVDSSVGGKTGVDFNGYKNIIGAFKQPELVYINTQTLKTLPLREFNSGMGEVIKHGIILDKNYFHFIEEHIEEIKKIDDDILQKLIFKSCEIKSKIVSEDEKEQGRRALLNFGHTVGHGIERLKNFELLHGECIAIGFMAALYISQCYGYINEDRIARVEDILKKFDLPVYFDEIKTEDLYHELFLDKKTSDNQLNFILINEIGKAFIKNDVNREHLLNGIHRTRKD